MGNLSVFACRARLTWLLQVCTKNDRCQEITLAERLLCLPTNSVGGSDSTYVTDYVYSNKGPRVAAFGGYAGIGLECGAAFLYAFGASSTALANVGAGLSF